MGTSGFRIPALRFGRGPTEVRPRISRMDTDGELLVEGARLLIMNLSLYCHSIVAMRSSEPGGTSRFAIVASRALPVNVRPYASTDLQRLAEIYTASIRTLAAPYYSADQIAAWAPPTHDAARWEERLAPLHSVVAEADGVLSGFASYTDSGYLDFLFTHPSFARRGVASRLYKYVEAELLGVGVPSITAHISLAARAFFDRHGFQLDAEECVECRGAYLRRFAMHKQLRHERSAQHCADI